MLENVDRKRGGMWWNEVVKDDLKTCGLNRGLAKDRERWKAQVMGKNVRPVRARTRDVKREREIFTNCVNDF